MARRWIVFFLSWFALALPEIVYPMGMKPGEFLVICYHNIPVTAHPSDPYGISQNTFVEQIEYLRTHGYHPISINDIVLASEGKKTLPVNPVLLSFDDAYISYYDFVAPVLKQFGYPSIVAVVGAWIDNPPQHLAEPLMNWDQIRELSQSNLVEVVSHTYDLHKGIPYNPQGNVGPAVNVRAYDPKGKRYETEQEYRERIRRDFVTQKALFKEQLGLCPRAVVWPYGMYNEISIEIAKEQGCPLIFTLKEGLGHIHRLDHIQRIVAKNPIVQGNVDIREFIQQVKKAGIETTLMRAVQVDLDLIYDPDSYERTDWNLGRLIDRLVAMKVNTVFLQAFSDPQGTGNIESVYFYNRVLPVKGDIFSHAVHQMIIREMRVYAWMPTLSLVLPDRALNRTLRVLEKEEGEIRPSRSWYQRLTPFSPKVRDAVRILYEDLAAHSQIHGILFQDDAYLTDKEDFHPDALRHYTYAAGQEILSNDFEEDHESERRRARYKTKALIDFTKDLMKVVRTYRPEASFARNLYAPLMTEPEAELGFAQHYGLFLENYDQVVVMAYPYMEDVRDPSRWLEELARTAKEFPKGQEKTVFKVQTYDWGEDTWIGGQRILGWLQDILAAGGRHLAYYPDNLWEDEPPLQVIKLEMSTKGYPFTP